MLQQLVDENTARKRSGFEGQMSLFDLGNNGVIEYASDYPDVEEFSRQELLRMEKEAAGMYLSGHPLEEYKESIRKIATAYSGDFTVNEDTGESSVKEGDRVTVAGIVTARRTKGTKNGRTMAFLTLEDMQGDMEIVAFPDIYERSGELLKEECLVYVVGHISIGRDENASVIAEQVISFGKERKEIWVAFADINEYNQKAGLLEDYVFEHPGLTPVVIYLRTEKAMKKMPTDQKTADNTDTYEGLCSLFGEQNVRSRIIGL